MEHDEVLDYAIALSLAESQDSDSFNGRPQIEEYQHLSTPVGGGGGKNGSNNSVRTGGFSSFGQSNPFKPPPRAANNASSSSFSTSFSSSNNRTIREASEQLFSYLAGSFNNNSNRHAFGGSDMGIRICNGCREPIAGQCTTVLKKYHYHYQCFRCAGCSRPIDQSFNYDESGSQSADSFSPFHPECYSELYHPRCTLCSSRLNGHFLRHPYFQDEVFCMEHEATSRRCFSCSRREPLRSSHREGFQELSDGRAICLDCISTAVLDSSEAKPIYLEAVDFMERVLGLRIPPGMRDVPVLAVDTVTLNEQQCNGLQPHHSSNGGARRDYGGNGARIRAGRNDGGDCVTRGLTISTHGEIQHMAPGGIVRTAAGIFVQGAPMVYHVEQQRRVSAVLVLYGLPRDLTASILAHEAMHVWFRLTSNMPNLLPAKLEEGLCQVIAHKLLDENDVWGAPYNNDSGCGPLKGYFRQQIENDPSEIYGDGFREAVCCCNTLGLDIVLECVQQQQQLPIIN